MEAQLDKPSHFKHGRLAMDMGNWARPNVDPCLLYSLHAANQHVYLRPYIPPRYNVSRIEGRFIV